MAHPTETDYTAAFLILSFTVIMAGAAIYHIIQLCLPPSAKTYMTDNSRK